MEIFKPNPYELSELLLGIAFSVVFSIIAVLSIIIWRVIHRKPIIQKNGKIESPNIFYFGIVFFGGSSILAFITEMPYHGIALLIFLCAYIAGLHAYKKGWLR